MRISIALATYNGEKYLAKQLDSLARQSLPPCECVICDDGSTDGTLEILQAFAASAPFPVHIHRNTTRLGYRENFLRCASLCSGELIAFCDQDDVWLDHKLQKVAAAFTEHPSAALVIHQGQVVDAQSRPTGDFYPRVSRAQLQKKLTCEPWVNIPGFAMTFKRELIHCCPWDRRPADPNTFDASAAHDTWILLMAEITGDIAFIPDNLVQYRRHGGNTTASIKVKKPPVPASLAQKIRRRLARMRQEFLRHAGLFDESAQLLLDLSTRCEESHRDNIRSASARYRRFAEIHWQRARIYDSDSPLRERLGCLRRLIVEDAYAPWSRGGVSRRALSKDFRYLLFGSL